ncbi:serine/threonine-protein kinase, partial [Couchioplanes caeruleus]
MSTSPPLVVADRYRLVAPLGQGGMGRVWRATDVVLHREVAIKELVPPPGLTPDERQEMRERSLREARAIARLSNINVVRVFDVLRTDADPWIVMEYVPSRSLQDILASDGPFNPVRAGEIGLGVLGALRAAHHAGVVHRDVKPGNVLIGEDGRVVLTDFGLATVPGDPNVTRTGLVLGSPAYIAPERARDGSAGPGADLWSLGATLYAAVEGASPFARSSAIATLAALATENPPPARNAGPLKPVLNGLLRKDPAHRINADETERLLLRATGRRSRLSFPMSATMRRPGAGRERPPIVPGVTGSAPVVPGPRPPVTSGRPPTPPPTGAGRTGSAPVSPSRGAAPPPVPPGRATPPNVSGRAGMGRATPPVTHGRVAPPVTSGPSGATPPGRPPVTPGRAPATPPPDQGRPTIFTPGKATVGRAPRPADAPRKPELDATRVDPSAVFSSTGTAKPPPPGQESGAEPPTTPTATMRGAGSALGSFTAEEVAEALQRQAGRHPQSTPTPAPPPPPSTATTTSTSSSASTPNSASTLSRPSTPSRDEASVSSRPETPSPSEATAGSQKANPADAPASSEKRSPADTPA